MLDICIYVSTSFRVEPTLADDPGDFYDFVIRLPLSLIAVG